MRLSKRAWNNVLIFSCMGMILIFNLMNDRLSESSVGRAVHILPEHSMILTLAYPDVSIERLGTSWRVSPSDSAVSQGVDTLIGHWTDLDGTVTLTSSEEVGYRISLWLAGEIQPLTLWLQPQSRLITDVTSQTTWEVTPEKLQAISMPLTGAK